MEVEGGDLDEAPALATPFDHRVGSEKDSRLAGQPAKGVQLPVGCQHGIVGWVEARLFDDALYLVLSSDTDQGGGIRMGFGGEECFQEADNG